MITSIDIKNEATYDSTGQRMEDLKEVNFIFGANGTGKTTISKVINAPEIYNDCSLSWKNENQLEARVYNQNFVENNFKEDNQLKGVFTLGEDDAKLVTLIDAKRSEVVQFESEIITLNLLLNRPKADGGKIASLKSCQSKFEKNCWVF
jgi:wobble nucleotide-excising tRNase